MSRHDQLRITWAPGQIWETRLDECAQDPNAWVPVGDGGRAEPVWDEWQEYRQRPEASPADGDCEAGDRCSCACHVRTDLRASCAHWRPAARWRFDATNGDPETGDPGDLVPVDTPGVTAAHHQTEAPADADDPGIGHE
jgi:hypothetical protein